MHGYAWMQADVACMDMHGYESAGFEACTTCALYKGNTCNIQVVVVIVVRNGLAQEKEESMERRARTTLGIEQLGVARSPALL